MLSSCALLDRIDDVSQGLPQNALALQKIIHALAHDFNNTLAVINTNLELIQEDLPSDSMAYKLSETALKVVDAAALRTAGILSSPSKAGGGQVSDHKNDDDYDAAKDQTQVAMNARGLDIDPLRILFIENTASHRHSGRQILEDLGHFVVPADTTQAGLDILSIDQSIDLLITDVMLDGGMSGISIARSAKSLVPGIKVMFMSGYTKDATGMKIDNVAGAPMVAKPFIVLELANALKRLSNAD